MCVETSVRVVSDKGTSSGESSGGKENKVVTTNAEDH